MDCGLPGIVPNGLKLQLTCKVDIKDLFDVPERLRSKGTTPLTLFGQETNEPTLIGWIPAASVL